MKRFQRSAFFVTVEKTKLMKKILFLLFASFFCVHFSQAALPDVNSNRIPIVDCSKLEGGTCKPTGGNAVVDACDNTSPYNDGGPEDYAGYCNTGLGGVTESRQDCCVPQGSATEEEITAATVSQWIDEEAICEAPRASGGYAGSCETVDTGLNPADLFSGGQCEGETPRYIGTCGSWGGNAVCCISQETADDLGLGGGTGDTLPLAYGDYQLLEQIPGSLNTSGKLQPYLESIYKAGFVLIVIGAIFMIGFGGFTYMASAGNTSLIKKGKGMITDAIIGLVVALLIWLILNIINPDLVNLKIDPLKGINFDPGGTGATITGENNLGDGGTTSSLPAQEAAKKLLDHPNVTLLNSSSCGAAAGAKSNLQQVSEGKGMTRCPAGGGGSVAANETLLNSLVDIANAGVKFQINSLAGGKHSSGSNHYDGTAVDIQRRGRSDLDTFFAKYPKSTCMGGKTAYQVSGIKICLEDEGHYHASLTGN